MYNKKGVSWFDLGAERDVVRGVEFHPFIINPAVWQRWSGELHIHKIHLFSRCEAMLVVKRCVTNVF